MDRSDWFMLWKNFHAWYNGVIKDSGVAPTWRRQQNKIHKLVTKAMHYRRNQPPVTGKRPVGRPRKHPKSVVHTPGPGPGRSMDNTAKEALPVLPPREQ